MLLYRIVLLPSLLGVCVCSLIGCDSSNSSANPTPDPNPALINSCETRDGTQAGESILDIQLPVSMGPGSRVVLKTTEEREVIAFDESSGALSLNPSYARYPLPIRYQVWNDTGDLVSEHIHRVVFEPLRIMPFGDSITSGVEFFETTDLPPLPLRVGYRKALYDTLTAKDYRIDFIGQDGQRAGQDAGLEDPDNNGFPGVNIGFLRTKLLELLAEQPTDVFLIHIGTNGTPENADELMLLLDEIDSWEAENYPVTVLLATIITTRNMSDNVLIDSYNADIRRQLQNRMNDRVILVEQSLSLTLDDLSLEAIGKHPSAAGYAKMANTWYEALKSSATVQRCDS